MKSTRNAARSLIVTTLAGMLAGGAVVGCELAVNPDVGLAEVPAPTCIPCLDASETVITEPDGNVVIVPLDSLGQDAGGDADEDAAIDAGAGADAGSQGDQ